ncbi:hypothetical protein RW080711_037 [Synechococcus phage S-RIM8]|uniref:Uncharacterized protein n=1 Tax=Synechococcus phage S-RIM8 TaxID=756278 RepID=A0A1D7SCB4_9CAUD|nr:hypothetical protein RW060613_037 [Synechococcus phage S-RIM8]AOO10846.1 hypothetical protein RW080711_037 [Synechococcus phage S-RIM8]AOO11292.1 hypothetical protein RW251112_037 [Synechococcus phage S-RIM8]QBQ75144.1 hypothetical protein RW010115_037 [Synechococcus phage S-RIM8]QBQ75587.1 hypothetical protein RW220214_037 [Synechococcus phage S-RIM8]
MSTLNVGTVNSTTLNLGVGGIVFNDATSITTAPGAPALGDVTNVTITTPAPDDILVWNGSQWVNQAPEGGIGLGNVASRPSSNLTNTIRWNTETEVLETYLDHNNNGSVAAWHAVGGRQLIAKAMRKDQWGSMDIYWGQTAGRNSGRYYAYEIFMNFYEQNGNNAEYYLRLMTGNGTIDSGGNYYYSVESQHINDGFPRNNENGQSYIRIVNSDDSYDLRSNGESTYLCHFLLSNTPNSSTANYWSFSYNCAGHSGQGGGYLRGGGSWRHPGPAEGNAYPCNGIRIYNNQAQRPVTSGVNVCISVFGISGQEGREMLDNYGQP